jgi:F0F1-type ATP synthase assembly protein I
VNNSSYHAELGKAVAAEHHAAGFFASIISGMLLGLGADALFDTGPLLVIIGIVAGSIIGFWRMWQVANHDG